VSRTLREAFLPLAGEGTWQLAAVGMAGGRAGLWLSGASYGASFQIGLVTETFTGLLLATMVVEGTVALEDPLSRYLPEAGASGIRLVDLATHTSGYPRVPLNIKARMLLSLRDPYAAVRDRHVLNAVRKLSPSLGAGPHDFQYSNFGYGVLSYALAAAGGQPFGALLRQKVLAPLGLEQEVTLETDPDPDRARLFGHSLAGQEVEHWHNPALPGAGFLFCSAAGMARYLEANLFPENTKLKSAFELVHQPREAAGPGMRVALGWLVRDSEDGAVHWRNGGTAGFGCFIGLDLARRAGVAVLMSRRHMPDLDQAAMNALSALRHP
jgi:D-alanyl-D-alanine-carboxypeptidase/D-alanyl-D-alanine-endopeptidase